MADPQRILFPTDFSSSTDHALLHAVQLAGFESGELIVQHVVNDYFEKHPHWTSLFGIHELQKELDAYVETHVVPTLGAARRDIRISSVISKGEIFKQIADLAEKEDVDLVVMGSVAGIHTNAVIEATDRPVLAVSMHRGAQHDVPTGKLRNILVATDFSTHSKKVVDYAFRLKGAFSATLYMLHVIQPAKMLGFGIRQRTFLNTTDRMRDWASSQLLNLIPDDFVNDPAVVRIVEFGPAIDRITEVAEEIGADITIVGTHEHGVVRKRIVGTTADQLLTTTASPVLTVKL